MRKILQEINCRKNKLKLGYSKEEAKEFIEVFLNYIKVNINEKENIKISKLASLKVISKKKELVVTLKQGKMQLSQKEK